MKVKWTVGLIITVGALALFFLSSTGNSKPVFYYNPSQFLANPKIRQDRVRLKGTIQPGSVKMSPDRLNLWFNITDGKQSIPVHYSGAIPDAFQQGLEVVVDGRMDAGNTFEGRELIVKCPSKYESKASGPTEPGPKESS